MRGFSTAVRLDRIDRDSPARLELARALTDLGAALRRAKQRADAREPLREALEIARRDGALAIARRAHDELAQTHKVDEYIGWVRHTTPGVEEVARRPVRAQRAARNSMKSRIGESVTRMRPLNG